MLYFAGVIYVICLLLPQIILQGLAGTYDVLADVFSTLATAMTYADVQEWYVQNASKLEATSNLSFLYSVLVTGTFALGLSIIHLSVVRRQEATTFTLFDGFSQLPRAVGIYIVKTVMTVLWSMLFLVPGVIAYYRYSLVYYLLIDNPHIGILQAIRQSGDLMRGNKHKRFILDLSFIPWCIPPVVILMIVFSYFQPIALANGGNGLFALYAGTYAFIAVLFSFVLNYRGVAAADFYQKIKSSLPSIELSSEE
jgi:uncharacterized membrane protein